MNLPDPPIPAECDISGMPFMPLETGRLLKSDLFNTATPQEGWAAFILWCRAWERTPPASLPNDDTALARLCGYVPTAWRKVKPVALHNFTLCSDGLLYHPLIADKALTAWLERLDRRRLSAAGNAKRHGTAFDPSEIDSLIEEARRRKALLGVSRRSPAGSATGLPTGSQVEVEVEGKKERTSQEVDTPLRLIVNPLRVGSGQ